MENETTRMSLFLLYKVLGLFAGGFCLYLGYRLFIKGINTPAGDLSASKGKAGLTLKNAAPGTFFVVLGAAIVLLTIYKGFMMSSRIDGTTLNGASPEMYVGSPAPEPAVDTTVRGQADTAAAIEQLAR